MRKAFLVLIFPFIFQNSVASAPDFSISSIEAWKRGVRNPKIEAAESFGRIADGLAQKHPSAYALSRYSDAPPQTLDRFARNFESLLALDPKAERHPAYLISLDRRIRESPTFKEDGVLFWAYVHLLFSFRKEGLDVEKIVSERKANLSKTLPKVFDGAFALSEEEFSEAAKTLEELSIPPFNALAVEGMRKAIEQENIGIETRYFRAYTLARKRLRAFDGTIRLEWKIPHTEQIWQLSCEANSLRDLINYYRWKKKESAIAEEAVALLFPASPWAPEYRDGKRIWADPEKKFVGRIDGRQSSNPAKLTGYGIHAEGVLPYARRELKKYGLKIDKKPFDGELIISSLLSGHPVVFWYVVSTEPNRGFARLQWETPEWTNRIGFVGEHVGIIVWVRLANDGTISEVSYYEWKSSTLRNEDFSSLGRKAKWFNEALYVTKDLPVNPSGTRKKNTRG